VKTVTVTTTVTTKLSKSEMAIARVALQDAIALIEERAAVFLRLAPQAQYPETKIGLEHNAGITYEARDILLKLIAEKYSEDCK
jgi:hypothetical protein